MEQRTLKFLTAAVIDGKVWILHGNGEDQIGIGMSIDDAALLIEQLRTARIHLLTGKVDALVDKLADK